MHRWIAGIVVGFVLLCSTSVRAQYNKEYFFWLGRTCMMNNDYQQAIRTLNTLLHFDQEAYEGYFLRGIAKYNLNDLLGADADFTIAIRKNPVFTTAYTYRAITRSRLGNYDDALRDFAEAIELRPDLPNPYYSRGVTRLLNQQFREAIDDFDLFIRQESKVADAYINRGTAYLYLKDTTRAYENFDAAIRTNRENPDAYNRRGSLYMQQERYKLAEGDFDMAIRNDSTYLLSYFNRALVYSDTKRPIQSLADLDKVIRLDSTNALTYFNRAIVRSQIGDYNRALEDYNRVVLYSPSNVLVYYNRALLNTRLGYLRDAESDYTKAIELYPDFANAYINRSNLRVMLNNPQGARSDYNLAQRKITNYRSRLNDSTNVSIFADTTQRFDRLLSFDSKFSGNDFEQPTSRSGSGQQMRLLPLFKFTLAHPDTIIKAERYHVQRIYEFKQHINNNLLTLSCSDSNIPTDSLILLDGQYASTQHAQTAWEALFQRGMTQSLIKQYTNAVASYSAAIEQSPSNPFLYLNRATTRAEMIDFISSIDNSYQRITIDADPANRLNNVKRNYNYDEAIADLNKVIKLFPELAHSYYNRANLYALSGNLPEAHEEYTRAIELNPSFAEAYYNRGLIQLFMKDTRKGLLDISKAGELGIDQAYDLLKRYTTQQQK